MKVDGSTCPEDSNSTDCLLRTLLQLLNDNRKAEDAKTDWDPITFAFTAVIGVIAIIFAFIPIIQTLLAAGKGRRKTSSRAIGKWSQKREWHWNGDEWTVEFTAWTPVITENSLRRAAQRKPNDLEKTGQPASRHASAATWLGFFQRVGLDNIPMPKNHEGLRSVVPDYLPDDLVAAPAYAQVGVIISAAATTGVRTLSIDRQTNYPLIMGFDYQFDFRQHPLLGIVGAFSRNEYDSRDDTLLVPTPDEILVALRYAKGYIRTCYRHTTEEHDEPTRDGPNEIDVFGDNTDLVFDSIANDTYCEKAFTQYHDMILPDYDLMKEYCEPISILFLASPLERPPALFPTSRLRYTHWLTALALNGRFWAETPLQQFSKIRLADWPSFQIPPDWLFPFRRGEQEAASTGDQETGFSDFLTQQQQSFATKTIHDQDSQSGRLVVLNMCMKMLHDPHELRWWFAISDLGTRKYLRWLALEQIKILDTWLKARHQKEHDGRWPLLCSTTIVILQADKAIREGMLADWVTDERPRSDGETVRNRHSDMLQTLRRFLDYMALDDAFEVVNLWNSKWSHKRDMWGVDDAAEKVIWDEIQSELSVEKLAKFEIYSKTVQNQSAFIRELGFKLGQFTDVERLCSVYQFLHRLRVVASPKTEEASDRQTLDDMIIFRCLTVALIYRTAEDSGPMLESGLWEHVVPIL